MENFTRINDSRINDSVKDVQSMTAGHNEAVVTHECQVLRQVSLWKFGHFEELFHGSLALLKDIEYFEALWIGQDFIDQGVLFVGLFWQGGFHGV